MRIKQITTKKSRKKQHWFQKTQLLNSTICDRKYTTQDFSLFVPPLFLRRLPFIIFTGVESGCGDVDEVDHASGGTGSLSASFMNNSSQYSPPRAKRVAKFVYPSYPRGDSGWQPISCTERLTANQLVPPIPTRQWPVPPLHFTTNQIVPPIDGYAITQNVFDGGYAPTNW